MAKFCNNECKSVCDFCKNYEEKYEFFGHGQCKISNIQVDASDGYNCEDFICFNVNGIE